MTELTTRLEDASADGWLTVHGRGGSQRLRWSDVHEHALRFVQWMHQKDIGPGSPLMLIGPTSIELITAIRAAWLAGMAVIVPSPPPEGDRIHGWLDRTISLMSLSNPALILGEPKVVTLLAECDFTCLEIESCMAEARTCSTANGQHIDENELAIIQPTSGTTGEPRAVMVPRRCLTANLDCIQSGLRYDPTVDVMMSWLPLFHDMGLIGKLGTPMTTGGDLVIADTKLFASQPSMWLQWCSNDRATIMSGPSFTYGLAAQLVQDSHHLDLSSIRLALNGSESVHVDTFLDFLAVAGRFGFDPKGAFAVYGLAEATLAVTFPDPGAGLSWDEVDTSDLARGLVERHPGGMKLAHLGKPLPGFEIEIREPSDHAVGDMTVGEIWIQGPSVTPGYLRSNGPELREASWLATGDLGYFSDGQLVICGRTKDLIICAGRNVFPQDLEAAAEQIQGVRPGRVAAFGVTDRGRERVVIVAESNVRSDNWLQLAKSVKSVVSATCDISVSDVRIVMPGEIPKTTSGKVSRSRAKSMYLEE